MSRWIHVGAMLTVLAAAACSSGGDERTAADSATGSNKQLKDLTADEVQTECQALATRLVLSKEDTCEFAGLMSTAFGQSCETVKAQCLAASSSQSSQEQPADGSCMPPTERRAGCSATIAEYEVCAVAQTNLIRSLTCTSSLSALNKLPQECEPVTQKCPRLFVSDQAADPGSAAPGGSDSGSADPGGADPGGADPGGADPGGAGQGGAGQGGASGSP